MNYFVKGFEQYKFKLIPRKGFWQKVIGLIGKKDLNNKEGIIIHKCRQIHTQWMQFNIDVIFLDKYFNIIFTQFNLKPFRISAYKKNAYYIIELKTNLLNKKIFKTSSKLDYIINI